MLKLKTLAAAAAFLLAGAASAATTDGFANGGFEAAGPSGWVAAGWLTAATASPATLSSDAHSGSFALLLSSKATDASIALQDSVGHGGLPALGAANVGDTPWLSFWAKGDASTTGNAFVTVRYMGATGILGTGINKTFQELINTSSWTQLSFQASAIPAGTTALFIEIGTSVGPLLDGRPNAILVDDLQFTLTTAPVPEPETYALMLAGLGAVAAIVRRRRA